MKSITDIVYRYEASIIDREQARIELIDAIKELSGGSLETLVNYLAGIKQENEDMSKATPITVGDIRQAIRNLPDSACVLFADPAFKNEREISGVGAIPVHDGRYGPTLLFKAGTFWFGGDEVFVFKIGGTAAEWGEQSYQDIKHDSTPGIEPDPDPGEPVTEYIEEREKLIEELLEKRGGR